MASDDATKEKAILVYDRRYRKKHFENSPKSAKTVEKTKPTGARLSEKLHEKLVKMAEFEKRTVNFLITEAVSELVSRFEESEQSHNNARDKWLKEFDKLTEEEQKAMLDKLKVEAFDLGR